MSFFGRLRSNHQSQKDAAQAAQAAHQADLDHKPASGSVEYSLEHDVIVDTLARFQIDYDLPAGRLMTPEVFDQHTFFPLRTPEGYDPAVVDALMGRVRDSLEEAVRLLNTRRQQLGSLAIGVHRELRDLNQQHRSEQYDTESLVEDFRLKDATSRARINQLEDQLLQAITERDQAVADNKLLADALQTATGTPAPTTSAPVDPVAVTTPPTGQLPFPPFVDTGSRPDRAHSEASTPESHDPPVPGLPLLPPPTPPAAPSR